MIKRKSGKRKAKSSSKKSSSKKTSSEPVVFEQVPLSKAQDQGSQNLPKRQPSQQSPVNNDQSAAKIPLTVCSLTKLKTLTSSIHLNKELETLCDLTVIDWPFYGKAKAAFAPLLHMKTLWKALHEFDILHIQYDIAGYMPLFLPMVWLLSVNKRAKVVLTLHEKYDNVPFAKLVIAFHNLWYQMTDALLVHTREHKDFLPKYLHDRTFVIPHGVIEAQNVHHLFDSNTILFAGYVNAWKGHDLAVKAMPLVIKEFPDAKLLFLPRSNDLTYEAKIKQMIKDLHLEFHVIWNDKRIEEWEMFAFFDAAAISLLPYRRITMSGILSHTMSRGVPAVLSDLPAFMEVTKGRALYFRNGDPMDLAYKIVQLLKNKEMQKRMSKEFMELTKEYAWSRMARMTLEVYQKCATESWD